MQCIVWRAKTFRMLPWGTILSDFLNLILLASEESLHSGVGWRALYCSAWRVKRTIYSLYVHITNNKETMEDFTEYLKMECHIGDYKNVRTMTD